MLFRSTNFAWFLTIATVGAVAVDTIDRAVAKVHNTLQRLSDRIRGTDLRMQASFDDLAAQAAESGEIDEAGMSQWLSTLGGGSKAKGGRGGGSWIGKKIKGTGNWMSRHTGSIFTGLTIYGLYRSIKSAMVEIIDAQGELAGINLQSFSRIISLSVYQSRVIQPYL